MNKIVNVGIISVFVALYLITSIISTIHSIDFFQMSNGRGMSIFLAVAFEIGAAASLASIVIYNRMHKGLVWTLFIVLTLFQVMNNVYFTYAHLSNYAYWIELFGLQDLTKVEQMRILSIVSGAVLPLVALGFIKSLVDYVNPNEEPVVKNEIYEDLKNDKTFDVEFDVPTNLSEGAIGQDRINETFMGENVDGKLDEGHININDINPHHGVIKGGL